MLQMVTINLFVVDHYPIALEPKINPLKSSSVFPLKLISPKHFPFFLFLFKNMIKNIGKLKQVKKE